LRQPAQSEAKGSNLQVAVGIASPREKRLGLAMTPQTENCCFEQAVLVLLLLSRQQSCLFKHYTQSKVRSTALSQCL
jgi:hypothetical protein